MAGLPGSGKSAMAEDLGTALHCAVLGVDQVEAAMWREGISRSEPTHAAAYGVVAALAAEQVLLRHDVIVDAVNGPEAARAHWRELSARLSVELRFIEVQCTDESTHRARLGQRHRTIEGFPEPNWEAVLRRRAEFPPWVDDRLTLDAMNSRSANLEAALRYIGRCA
ncbi:MAG TPA: AAA family ATPase [Candidatus Dormibacteraeota bacterium]|nr:AAA family ATPase [Candidatus Dormibacteraeota bacterium]